MDMMGLIALMAADAAPMPVEAIHFQLKPPTLTSTLHIGLDCESNGEEIVVCGRWRRSYRYPEVRLPPGVAEQQGFGIDLAPGVRLVGGGPHNSVGLGLNIRF
jgi:hypothetical protein